MRLYLDSSALVKRYVAEAGSEEVLAAMGDAEVWSICRIGQVETIRAVGLAAGRHAVKRVESDLASFEVVEVDAELAERAGQLCLSAELRSLDALHLAAALLLPGKDLLLATWDVRLHRAARDHDIQVMPESLPA